MTEVSTPYDSRFPRLTVVIPTLGGASLDSTIEALRGGTVDPDEILVCIPAREASQLRPLSCSNVRVVATECRGQVAQRAIGFAEAMHPLVLQLDDDLIVARDCIERLREALLELGPAWAVSPALIDAATGQSVYRTPERTSVAARLQFWMLNGREGYRAGRIYPTGAAVGVDPFRDDRAFHDVEWLPGGCVLHYRESLVLEPFYPFPGKAYCEDIIHSHHLTSRGIRLRIISKALVGVDIPRDTQSLREFARDLSADLRARRHYLRLSGGNPARAYLFGLNRCLGYVMRRGRTLGRIRRHTT